MTKRTKRVIIITAITLCIAAVIVAAVSMYVYIKGKKAPADKVSYKEIAADTKIPTKQYDNLDFSNTVLHVPEADKLYRYYMTGLDTPVYTQEETATIARELFARVFDHVDINKTVLGKQDGTPLDDEQAWDPTFRDSYFWTSYDKYEYDDPNSGMNHGCTSVYDVGAFLACYLAEYTVGFSVDTELVECIDLDRGEQLPDKAYELGGRQYKMQDALDLADSTIQKIKDILPDVELRAEKFLVYRCNNGDSQENIDEAQNYYQYQIEYEFVLDGVPFADSYPSSIDLFKTLFDVKCCCLRINICTPEEVEEIESTGPINCIQGKDEQPLKDEFLTLESACDILSDFLAPNYVQHINEVTVKYAFAWDDTTDHTGEKLYSRPCWCFIIDEGFVYPYTYTCEKQLLVDMQTGDIFANVADEYVSNLTPQSDKNILQQQKEQMN